MNEDRNDYCRIVLPDGTGYHTHGTFSVGDKLTFEAGHKVNGYTVYHVDSNPIYGSRCVLVN